MHAPFPRPMASIGRGLILVLVAAAIGAVILAFCMAEPGNRKDFAKRHKRSLLAGIAEPVSHLSWSGAVALWLDSSLWALLPAGLAILFVAGMWVWRPSSAE